MEFELSVCVHVRIGPEAANIHEILAALAVVQTEFVQKCGALVLEEYQEELREILCCDLPHAWLEPLGRHARQGRAGAACPARRFVRAGWQGCGRRLKTDLGPLEFAVAMVRCRKCGRRLNLLAALGLAKRQRRSDQLVREVTEAVAETSYRRGCAWAAAHSGVPVPRSTAHRWAATIEPSFRLHEPPDTLLADGTGFKRQPGQRGEVRMVLGLNSQGKMQPLGVWAGTDWKDIAQEVTQQLAGQPRPRLLVADGEERLEMWLGRLTERVQRCQWHFVRQSEITAWKADMPKKERTALREQLRKLVAIEIPQQDLEMTCAADRPALTARITEARMRLQSLASDLEQRGYPRAATYLLRAEKHLFSHLEQWLETGIIGSKTTSIIESTIRELVRRLKKIGCNWSDAGAERLGQIVLIRRYDAQEWEQYWQTRLGLHGRCQMRITGCTRAA